MATSASRRPGIRRRLAAAPPERIADGVWLLRGGLLRSMNVYLIEGADRATIYDAGEKGMAESILAAARRLGEIERVVLSHADTTTAAALPR